jgi:hypothetical protein
MRVISSLVRIHNPESIPMEQTERDFVLLQAIQMIRYDNVLQSSKALLPFKWYSIYHFPFPAYLYLAQELHHRVTGPLVERAWDAITANNELRPLFSVLHSSMPAAFGTLFLKAWDAYECAQVASRHVIKPQFIVTFQNRGEKRERARAENRQDPSLENEQVDIPSFQWPDNAIMTAPMNLNSGSAHSEECTGDMDWSYMVPGYQDMPILQGMTRCTNVHYRTGGMGPVFWPGTRGGMSNMEGSA